MRVLYPEFLGGPRAVGLLAVRLVAGSAFVLHGWPKIQNATHWMPEGSNVPGALQAVAALSEFGGGLAWIFGFLTPLATLGIGFTMMAAIGMVHLSQGHPFVGTPGAPSYELALVYWSLALLLLLAGPGRISLDALLFGRRPALAAAPQAHTAAS